MLLYLFILLGNDAFVEAEGLLCTVNIEEWLGQ